MRAYGTCRCVHHLFLQNKIIGYKEEKDIQQRVAPTTSRIPESLDRHQFSEGRVEKINYSDYPTFQHGRKFSK